MDARDVQHLVHEQIDGRWEETNSHAVDLRAALITPTRSVMIMRVVQKGITKETAVNVWTVLEETPDGDGYVIFYDEVRDEFGLATRGLPVDRHPVICGYYGDFWNAFKGM